MVLTGLAGLAVGALSVGAVWLTTGPQVADKRPIASPSHIGEYVPLFQAKLDPDLRMDLVERLRENNRRSSELLSRAHGGAKDPLWVGLSVVVHAAFIGIPIALFTRRAIWPAS